MIADILAHDFRNQLNVARGHLELARDRGEAQYFDVVRTSMDRMAELAEEAILLARTGRLDAATTPHGLREVTRLAWEALPTEEATLETPDSAEIRANRFVLRHLLENLLQNAVVHGGSGVTVCVSATDEGFSVQDDGPGIPDEDRSRLFADGTPDESTGHGRGLTLAKRLAEAHGWQLTVTEGSTGGARIDVVGPRSN